MKSRRGNGNPARDRAVYFLRKYSIETLAGVGRYFDIANYSTVSSIIDRVKNRKLNEKALDKQLTKIEKMLYKSQRET